MPLCLHIGSSSHIYQPPSPDSPITVAFTTDFLNAQYTLIEWIFSGVFDRFEGLRICLSEGGVGWIPHCLERCDMKYDRYAAWAGCGPSRRPSEYLADHISVCLLEDIFGSGVLEAIGLDNVLVEVDYPHADPPWPRSSGDHCRPPRPPQPRATRPRCGGEMPSDSSVSRPPICAARVGAG